MNTQTHTTIPHDPAIYAFRTTGARDGGQLPDDASSLEDDADKRPLRCRICGAIITHPSAAMPMQGAHRHVFSNPAGISYEIGCFSHAPGCVTAGAPTEEYTWFAGYAWSVALCGGCFNHIGWRYTDGGGGFFGLILAMLAE